MGLSELIVIIIIGAALFTPVGRNGFSTGFKEGLKKNIKKQLKQIKSYENNN
jgi:hypothetical protein